MSSDIDDLIDQYLTDSAGLSPAQIKRLSDWIVADPAHQRQYLRAAVFHRVLHDLQVTKDPSRKLFIENLEGGFDAGVFEQELSRLLKMEREAETISVERPEPAPTSRPSADTVSRPKQQSHKFWLSLAAATAAAIVILVSIGLFLSTRPRPVATLIDSHHAKWRIPETGIEVGSRLWDRQGQPLALLQGFTKVQFDNGTVLVMEGPLEFQIKDENSILLNYGRLCTRVPKYLNGFRVDTPLYGIVDLGTEFGVEVAADGSARVQMYDGQAFLEPHGVEAEASKEIIARQQARQIDINGQLAEVKLDPRALVRQFSSTANLLWRGEPLDLADIITGGSGMGRGRLHWGIELTAGDLGPAVVQNNTESTNEYLEIKRRGHIDGIFIPTGDIRAMQVSSAGHTFVGCPKTSGVCPGGLVLGGFGQKVHRLSGDSPDEPSRSLILFHSNQGITFDLASMRTHMRNLHPEIALPAFRARIGFSDSVVPRLEELGLDKLPRAEFWVLVDGELQFHEEDLMPTKTPIAVEVALDAQASFLTLMVTDGDDDTSHDWVLLSDPTLEVSY